MAADGGPCEAGGAVRRQLPPDRLRAVEPGQRAGCTASACSPSTSRTRWTGTSPTTWRLSSVLGQYITTVPAQQRLGRRWYTGSADAIFQSQNLVFDERPDYIAVFGADHVYRMDPAQMIAAHIASGAGVTVAGIRVPRAEAKAFGCIASDAAGRITEFLEKPARPAVGARRPRGHVRLDGQLRLHHRRAARRAARPTPRTATPTTTWAATSSRAWSRRARRASTTSPTTSCPAPPTARRRATGATSARSTPTTRRTPTSVSVHPIFNLYNQRWPIRTAARAAAAGQVRRGRDRAGLDRRGRARSSPGAIVRRSVISPNVRIDSGRRGVGLGGDARRARGPGRGRARRDPRQERRGPGRGADRGRPRRRTGRRYTVSPGGVVVLGKGVTASPEPGRTRDDAAPAPRRSAAATRASRPSPTGSRAGTRRSSSRTWRASLAQRRRVGVLPSSGSAPPAAEHVVQHDQPAGAQQPHRLVEVARVLDAARRRRTPGRRPPSVSRGSTSRPMPLISRSRDGAVAGRR